MSKNNKKNGVSKNTVKHDDVARTAPLNQSPVDLVSVSPEKIVVSTDDASKIRQAEETVLRAKLQLSDLELSMADLAFKKSELLNQIRHNNSEMMSVVRAIAETYGIDPDGQTNDSKWNLNTNDMIFYRVK